MGIPRYPNFSGKHVGDAVISPTDAVARYLADAELARPDAVVLTYQRAIADELRARRVDKSQGYPAPWRSLWFIEAEERRVATVFRKTRSAENAEVARAMQAQKICESTHGIADEVFDREVT
jgi:hypothetical protein